MSDYKNPRPSPSASASDPCAVYDNSVSFDKLINESEVVVTYKGVELQSVPSLLEQIEAEANTAIMSLGWHQVGLLADGFTYTLQNDIAKDAAGDWYRWNGTLPKVVTAGTLPSSDVNFVKIDYKSHAELSDRNPGDGTAHNADDIFGVNYLMLNIAEATAYTSYSENQVIYITDIGYLFKYSSSRLMIAGQAQSEVLVSDEFHKLTDSGGMLEFHDWAALRIKETENYAKYCAKLYDRTTAIKIDCYGDSITFGQALNTTSALLATNRIGDPTLFGDGSVYDNWQYNDNYPVVIQQEMSKVFVNTVTITNKGFSGDRVLSGYLKHLDSTPADVATVMYGVNDVLFGTSNGANPDQLTNNSLYSVDLFIDIMRKFVAREILRGKSVVILGTVNFGSLAGYEGTGFSATKLDQAYNDAMASLAIELGCRFVDTRKDIIDQYGMQEFTQEGTHPNENGHKVLGARLAAALMTPYKSPVTVGSGDIVIANPATNALRSKTSLQSLIDSNSSNPFFGFANEKNTISLPQNVPVTVPFYCYSADLVAFINIRATASATSFTIKLDGGAIQSNLHFSGDYVAGKPASSKSITGTYAMTRDTQNYTQDGTESMFHIASKGWHSITIENTSALSLLLDSISFVPFETVRANDLTGETSKFTAFGAALTPVRNCTIVNNATFGTYTVTFGRPMANTSYSVNVSAVTDNEDNSYMLRNKTVDGYELVFIKATNAVGAAVVMAYANPVSLVVTTSGGR